MWFRRVDRSVAAVRLASIVRVREVPALTTFTLFLRNYTEIGTTLCRSRSTLVYTSTTSTNRPRQTPSTMADEDDLDAFFDEVSEVEAQAAEESDTGKEIDNAKTGEGEDKDDEEPPAKRVKTSASVRPRGVVVAASTSVVMPAEEREIKEAQLEASSQLSTNIHPNPASVYAKAASAKQNEPSNSSSAPTANNPPEVTNKKKGNPKVSVRSAAGQTWVDKSLEEWPEDDFRIFVGNLSNEVTDQALFKHFEKYPSLARARVVRDLKNPEKSKGYGFVSLLDPLECARALREMDQTWLGSRPIRIKRSDWKDRDFKTVKKREKKEKKQQKRTGRGM